MATSNATRKPSTGLQGYFLTGVLLALFSRTCSGCSPAGPLATDDAQWLAAAWVVEGTTESVTECSDDATRCDGSEYGSWVRAKDIITKKGPDLGCAYIEIAKFSSSAECGIDPPEKYSVNTYFLCSLEVIDQQAKTCKAVMNKEGNIHLGMVSGVVPVVDEDTAPSTCPQRGTCRSVDYCETFTSDKCCQDLRSLKFKYNRDKAVCAAASKQIDDGGCKQRTWYEANIICNSAGYRLCTHDELLAKEAARAGCNTKRRPAWTSTPCKYGHMTATTGKLKSDDTFPIKSRCKGGFSTKAKVVCCADRCDS